MNSTKLVSKYREVHSYDHASQRAASDARDVCYVPRPVSLGGDAEDTRSAVAEDATAVCFVP